jgi:signal transduction histidine kinase
MLEINEFCLYEEGKVVGIIGVARDITRRLRLQEVMVQNEKMMSIGGLAAGMAHEINNPLGGILHGIQNIRLRLLHTERKKNIEEAERLGLNMLDIAQYMKDRKVDTMLDGIESSASRAGLIVRNMLDFSRKTEKKLVPIDLAEVVERAIHIAENDYDLKKNYDFRHIKIKKEIEKNIKVDGIASEIEQVVLNLLKNAAHAMNNSHVKAPQININISKKTDMVELRVCDNGPGMSEEIRGRVFEPFYTTKDRGSGTGLGLSVCYFIITENHKGKISVASEKGKGTCFNIMLPISEKNQ